MSSYNEVALDAYQAELDQQDSEDGAIEAIKDRLRLGFLAAVTGTTEGVEYPCTPYRGVRQIRIQSTHDAVQDVYDAPEVQRCFQDVHIASECPLANRYTYLLERGTKQESMETPDSEMTMLRDSECPAVALTRVAMADAYADLYAKEILKIERAHRSEI